MKKFVLLLSLAAFLAVSCAKKEQEPQVSFTPCQQTKATKSELSDTVNVEFTNEGVKIKHYNFEVTCDFTTVDVTHTLLNGVLNITQQGYPTKADCVCYTDVSYTINGISKNEVNVIIINDEQVYCNNEKPEYPIEASGTAGNLIWKIIEDGTLIISGTGEIPNYNIPAISAPWYDKYRSSITAVVIESGVTSIGAYAFYLCEGLTSATIPNSVTSIGNKAFYACSSLTEINIPNSVTSIGYEAFTACSGLTGTLTIPNSVTFIESCVFGGCIGLTSVIIPNSVTSIGGSAFVGCSGLTEVTIPNSVTSIGNGAFERCSGLTSVIIGNSVTYIGSYAFYNCINLSGTLSIPESATYIGGWAFSGCSGLTGILTIPNSVTDIGNVAFGGCIGFTEVIIGNSVTSIGYGAFNGCSGLTSITMPKSVESIDVGTFGYCSGLTEINVDAANSAYSSENGVLFNKEKTTILQYPTGKTGTYTIPNSVTAIGPNTFGGCSVLTEVTIPNSVTSIEYGAFYSCSGLTEVTIPNSVIFIGNYAFDGCSGLTGTLTIPNSVTTIQTAVFNDCSGLTEVTIGNSVASIGYGVFNGCSSLIDINVDADNSAYSSENGVLFDKTKTTLIQYPAGKTGAYTIPNSVTAIAGSAFGGCSGLMSVIIPSSVTSIGEGAFYNCINLTEIINQRTTPQATSRWGSFSYEIITTCTLRVPAASVAAYKDATGWKDFVNIVAIE